MELATKYDPAFVEDKWYALWMKNKLFCSAPDDREPYTVVIPPPNVTGVLHMGHMLNNTIQDVLVRRARMQGKNACWVPGTDHASIATEAKVVAKLKSEGIEKSALTRDEFLKHAWEWKEKHGGIILEQLKKLGASCDWERTHFTMDQEYSQSVIDVFIDLYKKGLIYRGVRMVNWDPQAKTALSDEEVNYKEVNSKLYYVKYLIEGTSEFLTVATTRPETILGDTAVCVNPNDERYKKFHGKNVIVPVVNRSVPIIQDEYVDMEFGTGCLKITPAHDLADYELGLKYNLPVIDIFNDNGSLNENGAPYTGKDRFAVKKMIVADMEAAGLMVKIEDYTNKIGFSERTDAVIEPKLSVQWFLKMKDISKPALDCVMDDRVQLHPPKFKNVYRHWMENVKDWCISRQLWWGHRIPAYYVEGNNEAFVANSAEEALEMAKAKTGNTTLTIQSLKQDEDVLDTWFSSWLWPISVFNGLTREGNKDINYYYPTNDLVTAPEILFFWVARMIIAGLEYKKEVPFKNVYLTGIVRDKQGRKMSKSLGNSPDPIELIQKYGADGVRIGMLYCSPAGNDLLFDENLTEQGRNFSNKIWNAFRLVKQWETNSNLPQPLSSQKANEWFRHKLSKSIEEIDSDFQQFRISEALMKVYKLFWDDFSAVYLEIIKPVYQQPIDQKSYNDCIAFFDELLRLLHPFMPFITEELWHAIEERDENTSLMLQSWPKQQSYNEQILSNFELAQIVVREVRNTRNNKGLSPKEALNLVIMQGENKFITIYEDVIKKQANIDSINFSSEKLSSAVSFIAGTVECFIPLQVTVNKEEELSRLSKELEHAKGFLMGVNKKLENEKFVANAAQQVLDLERKKQHDAKLRIQALEEQIKLLSL